MLVQTWFLSIHGICVCYKWPYSAQDDRLEWGIWRKTVQSSGCLFTHSCAITTTLFTTRITHRHSVWDSSHTKPYFFPLHPFQMRQHMKRVPQSGFSWRQITWFLDKVCVQLCDTKQQRFANSRLCDVRSFYSLSSSVMCLSPRQCLISYSQSARGQCQQISV